MICYRKIYTCKSDIGSTRVYFCQAIRLILRSTRLLRVVNNKKENKCVFFHLLSLHLWADLHWVEQLDLLLQLTANPQKICHWTLPTLRTNNGTKFAKQETSFYCHDDWFKAAFFNAILANRVFDFAKTLSFCFEF